MKLKRRPKRNFASGAIAIAALTAVVVGLNSAVVYGLSKTPFDLFNDRVQRVQEQPQEEQISFANAQNSPAQDVVSQLVAYVPPSVSSLSSLSETDGTPDGPYAWVCDASPSASPAISQAKTYSSDSNNYVGVVVQAYGAGVGNTATEQYRNIVSQCSNGRDGGAYRAGGFPFTANNGLSSTVVQSGKRLSAFTWNQGDVLVHVFGTNADLSRNTALEVNNQLLTLLSPICANIDESLNDTSRSPYYDPNSYQGFTSTRSISLDVSEVPALRAGVIGKQGDSTYSGQGIAHGIAPVDILVANDAIPGADLQVQQVSLPKKPLEPAGDVQLPQAVDNPGSAPVVPTYPGTTAEIPERVKDEVGPGCGWAFTGQNAPLYDDEVEKQRVDALVNGAQKDLQNQHVAYASARGQYINDYASYQSRVSKYNTYALQVQEVATVWDDINTKRAAYRKALDAYYDSVERRDAFLSRQQAAQTKYDQDVQYCENFYVSSNLADNTSVAVPSPTPTTSPTPTPTPTTPTPTQEPTATPSPSTSSPSESPTPRPTIACPPSKPSILNQAAPAVPVPPQKPDVPLPYAWTDVPN